MKALLDRLGLDARVFEGRVAVVTGNTLGNTCMRFEVLRSRFGRHFAINQACTVSNS
jgi:hypothetical protein